MTNEQTESKGKFSLQTFLEDTNEITLKTLQVLKGRAIDPGAIEIVKSDLKIKKTIYLRAAILKLVLDSLLSVFEPEDLEVKKEWDKKVEDIVTELITKF